MCVCVFANEDLTTYSQNGISLTKRSAEPQDKQGGHRNSQYKLKYVELCAPIAAGGAGEKTGEVSNTKHFVQRNKNLVKDLKT